ncbi:MAG TPA: class II aldolase/adducin family protein [Acidobacteriaceae bacterium]|nr:class II aldolase/adducin family protein [Acidobacteriaceae bacterium]
MQTLTTAFIASVLRRAVLECIGNNAPVLASDAEAAELFNSAAAQALKEEIVAAGRKLWQRQYVDGNGGNISVRLTDEYILCTPTLCSKGDMTADDLSLVDLENRQICGDRAQTSEILLHLEIYKAVPTARAVIHCHPPYATAHAVAGVIPRGDLIPEQEVFVGPLALAPYETPGTMAFARTVLPFVQEHNTILLTNHGVVCWADTVAHAEWYAEVVENYCKIVTIASQLGTPIRQIPAEKIPGLLAMKKKLGLPDPRLAEEYARLGGNHSHAGQSTGSIERRTAGAGRHTPRSEEVDELVERLTSQVLALLEKSE